MKMRWRHRYNVCNFKQTVKLNFAWVNNILNVLFVYDTVSMCSPRKSSIRGKIYIFRKAKRMFQYIVAIFKEDLSFNWVSLNTKQTNFYTFKYFAKNRAKLKINITQSWELSVNQGVGRVWGNRWHRLVDLRAVSSKTISIELKAVIKATSMSQLF